jgi:ssDNA-binding Zn-finger/Zn-ribbon topoisomerase 1
MTQSRASKAKIIQEELAKPFDIEQSYMNNGVRLSYVSAQQVQERLDQVLGLENWQDEYKIIEPVNVGDRQAVECTLSLYLDGRWITKIDCGYPESSNEPLKDAYSDSLKRAAVKFGVGRYMYLRKLNAGGHDNTDDWDNWHSGQPSAFNTPPDDLQGNASQNINAPGSNLNILSTVSMMINEDGAEWPHLEFGGLNHPVPECKNHAGVPMVQKSTRGGSRTFWGCPNYSTEGCRYTYDHDKLLDEIGGVVGSKTMQEGEVK